MWYTWDETKGQMPERLGGQIPHSSDVSVRQRSERGDSYENKSCENIISDFIFAMDSGTGSRHLRCGIRCGLLL